MSRFSLVVLAAGLLLQSGKASFAQKENIGKEVTVSGNSLIYSQFSTRKGNYQEIPTNFARLELNNTFYFSGIPVITSIFFSTEQSRLRQNISGFRVGLDARAIRNKMDVKSRFFSFFPTLEIGNCRPVFSSFTLNGVNLRGINAEFNPGSFYSAFAAGRLVRAVEQAAPAYQTFDRNLTFGRLGVGKIRQSFFALSFLHAKDDPESIAPNPYWYQSDPDTLTYNAETFIHAKDSGYLHVLPKENYVASAELNLSLFRKKFLITGEFAGSLATANQNTYGYSFEEMPDQLREWFSFNASSCVDYAWILRTSLKLKDTDISGSARYVGPGFVSLGTACLRSDVNQFEGSIVQYMIRKKIRIQAFYKTSYDNVLHWKSSTTRLNNWGFNASFRFPKAPYLTILYTPYYSSYKTQNKTTYYNAGNFSLTSGFQLITNITSSFTNIIFSLQNGKNNVQAGDTKMKNMNLMISETLDLGIRFSFSASLGINDLETSQIERKTLSYNGKMIYKGFHWMHTCLGISGTSWKETVGRNKLYINTLIDLGKFGSFTVQADWNRFVNHMTSGKDYTEYILKLGYAHRW